MLKRLMFVYFVQKKGLLDGDPDYLGNHLRRPWQENAQNQVHSLYIAKNTIIPDLFDAAREVCAGAFKKDSALWSLLRENPDRYIYTPVLKGVDLALPEEIAAGLSDVARRGGWNKPADRDFALPTETWREHIARRQRGQNVRARLEAGEIHSIDDFITDNLDIRQFARDAIDNAEDPELVRAFEHAIERVTILDPTCGSGAFLFAALNFKINYDLKFRMGLEGEDAPVIPGGNQLLL